MNDEELFRLNSLHRFSKHSKLVLEAHSHCEVPAGCGGAVLQWLNPALGVPVRVEVQSAWSADESFIDGVRISGAGTRLLPGAHVLAFTLRPPKTQKTPIAADPWVLVNMTWRVAGEVDERVPAGCSRPDGSWRASFVEPQAQWALSDFDDSNWSELGASSTAGDLLEDWLLEEYQNLTALGCVPLALGRHEGPRLWVRKRWSLPEFPRP